jgi:hypothetical protein
MVSRPTCKRGSASGSGAQLTSQLTPSTVNVASQLLLAARPSRHFRFIQSLGTRLAWSEAAEARTTSQWLTLTIVVQSARCPAWNMPQLWGASRHCRPTSPPRRPRTSGSDAPAPARTAPRRPLLARCGHQCPGAQSRLHAPTPRQAACAAAGGASAGFAQRACGAPPFPLARQTRWHAFPCP